MAEDKKALAPEVRALIKDICHRFRDALSLLGQEKQVTPIEKPMPSKGVGPESPDRAAFRSIK